MWRAARSSSGWASQTSRRVTAPRSEVAEDGPSGQRVVGVPAHGATVQARSPVGGSGPAGTDLAASRPDPASTRPSRVYTRTDISERYIGHTHDVTEPDHDVLDLAILGLLKEQPLHGYELKKRLGETLGSLWGISYGSLYPALRRLEHDGSIESVEARRRRRRPMPATGSLDGDLAAARQRRPAKATRRTRKAYRITDRGDAPLSRSCCSTTTPPATTSAPSR